MITHFVAVFCVGNNASNTLTNFDNVFEDKFFFNDHTFVAVFYVGNNASNRKQDFLSHQTSFYLGLEIFSDDHTF